MDNIDLKIIDILQADGRITMKELGQRVGLTSPATIERVKKLEESGIISGYRAVIDVARAGLPIRAFLLITLAGQSGDAVVDFARRHAGVVACHRLAGSAAYIVEAVAAEMADLERMLDDALPLGGVETHLVLSTALSNRPVVLP